MGLYVNFLLKHYASKQLEIRTKKFSISIFTFKTLGILGTLSTLGTL